MYLNNKFCFQMQQTFGVVHVGTAGSGVYMFISACNVSLLFCTDTYNLYVADIIDNIMLFQCYVMVCRPKVNYVDYGRPINDEK